MFFKNKTDPRPRGVPLDELLLGLGATTLSAKRVGDSLVVTHEHFSTTVDVVRLQAVVQVRTALPAALAGLFREPHRFCLANRNAARRP